MYSVSHCKMNGGQGSITDYLSHADYVSMDGQTIGIWQGELAKHLGLEGKINLDDLKQLEEGNYPNGERAIPQMKPKTRIVNGKEVEDKAVKAHDFTFSAPKSISIASLVNGDNRLIEAHEKAVELALREMETLSGWRANNEERFENTEKLAIAKYTHDTSRALDPQLHTHCAVLNMTLSKAGKMRALEADGMCRNLQYVSSIYNNALARNVMNLGYSIELSKNEKGHQIGFELAGSTKEERDLYSKRSEQVKERIAELKEEYGDNLSQEQIRNAVTECRDYKKYSSPEENQANWKAEREQARIHSGVGYREGVKGQNLSQDIQDISTLVDECSESLNERSATFKSNDLANKIIFENLGHWDLGAIKASKENTHHLEHLKRDKYGTIIVTRKDYYELEKRSIRHLNEQKGIHNKFSRGRSSTLSKNIKGDARKAIEGVMKSKDGMIFIQGTAGAGKTYMLQHLKPELEKSGWNIMGLAPSGKATIEMDDVGIKSQTVHRLLADPREQAKINQDTVLVIDEASFSSQRLGSELEKLQHEKGCRILFVGDTKQLKAVDAGEYVRNMKTIGNMKTFGMEKTRRFDISKSPDYKHLSDDEKEKINEVNREAVDVFRDNPDQGFDKFEKLGVFHESKDLLQDATKEAIALLKQAEKNDKQGFDKGTAVGIVADTRAEVKALNEAIRKEFIKPSTEIKKTVYERDSSMTKAEMRKGKGIEKGDTLLSDRGEKLEVIKSEKGKFTVQNDKGKVFEKTGFEGYEKVKESALPVAVGDVVQITKNYNSQKSAEKAGISKPIKNGQSGRVTGIDKEGNLKVKVDGKTVKIGKDFKNLEHGLARTAHKSQGATFKKVVAITKDPASQKSEFVKFSRHKESLKVFLPNKKEVKDKLLKRSGIEKSALEHKPGKAPAREKPKAHQMKNTGKLLVMAKLLIERLDKKGIDQSKIQNLVEKRYTKPIANIAKNILQKTK